VSGHGDNIGPAMWGAQALRLFRHPAPR
jgi:hypothetical protein